jgi:hypothetical protein
LGFVFYIFQTGRSLGTLSSNTVRLDEGIEEEEIGEEEIGEEEIEEEEIGEEEIEEEDSVGSSSDPDSDPEDVDWAVDLEEMPESEKKQLQELRKKAIDKKKKKKQESDEEDYEQDDSGPSELELTRRESLENKQKFWALLKELPEDQLHRVDFGECIFYRKQ